MLFFSVFIVDDVPLLARGALYVPFNALFFGSVWIMIRYPHYT